MEAARGAGWLVLVVKGDLVMRCGTRWRARIPTVKRDSIVTPNSSKGKHHLFGTAMDSIKASLFLTKDTDRGVLMLFSNTATGGELCIFHL